MKKSILKTPFVILSVLSLLFISCGKSADENFPADLILTDLIGKKQLAAFETRAKYYEVGSKEGLRNFTRYIRNGRE